jgi:hypothetical protein
MVEEKKQVLDRGSAPFNMAIDTLQRLGDILREIKDISADLNDPLALKQVKKLNLIKQFFYNAVPLLPNKIVEAYEEKIINLNYSERAYGEKMNAFNTKILGKIPVYDVELEIKIDKLLVNIQKELQKEKYFMPPKHDARFGWKQG